LEVIEEKLEIQMQEKISIFKVFMRGVSTKNYYLK